MNITKEKTDNLADIEYRIRQIGQNNNRVYKVKN